MKTDQFRLEHNKVFEFDKRSNCYVFIGTLTTQTLEDFINEYKEFEGDMEDTSPSDYMDAEQLNEGWN
jgi:hypothetical protein|tara:strand:+ start:136 stop:339 length:204 start_codon:yes stop_codon:yes gene_type:complete